jgi:hypothetical protein
MTEKFHARRGSVASGRCKLSLVDAATGRVVKASGWISNTVLDAGLNNQAAGNVCGFGDFFLYCKVGSGSAPIKIQNPSVTFTQSGTTITASAGFFTSTMTGAIFKFGSGSGGVEQYITYVDATHATTTFSQTVGTGTAGAVWMVQVSGLTAWTATSSTWATQVSPVVIASNVLTLTRTMNFATQSAPMTVNEVGYSQNNNSDGTCNGMIVLGSSWVVSTSQFLQVTWQLAFTLSPGAPTAVGNVGTSFNTAGTAMINNFDNEIVDGSGVTQEYLTSHFCNLCDWVGATDFTMGFVSALQSLPTTIGQTTGAGPGITDIYQVGNFGAASRATVGNGTSQIGVQSTRSVTFSIATAGETFNHIAFGYSTSPTGMTWIFALNLANPQTLPNGTFAGAASFSNTFSRVLFN